MTIAVDLGRKATKQTNKQCSVELSMKMLNLRLGSSSFYFRLLTDAVLNFQNNQEEVTVIVNPEKIILKNYVDDEPGRYYSFITPQLALLNL